MSPALTTLQFNGLFVPLALSFFSGWVFLILIFASGVYKTRQGKLLIGLPLAYNLWISISMLCILWIHLDPNLDVAHWCKVLSVGRTSTESLIALYELAIVIWYTILVSGVVVSDFFEIVFIMLVFVVSGFLGWLDFVLETQRTFKEFGVCKHNINWFYFLEILLISQVFLLLVLLLGVFCFIKTKINSVGIHRKLFWQVMGFPAIFIILKLPQCIAQLLQLTNMIESSFVLLMSFEVASSTSGLFSVLYFIKTRNVFRKMKSHCLKPTHEESRRLFVVESEVEEVYFT